MRKYKRVLLLQAVLYPYNIILCTCIKGRFGTLTVQPILCEVVVHNGCNGASFVILICLAIVDVYRHYCL